MPNYVTNRLEINADRETVQNVMDFLKGKTVEVNIARRTVFISFSF